MTASASPRGEHLLGLRGVVDHADGAHRHAGDAADVRGQRDLVAGTGRQLLVRDESAAGDVEEVRARLGGPARDDRGLVGVPAAVGPVGGGEPHEQRRRRARHPAPHRSPAAAGARGSRASRRTRRRAGSRAARGTGAAGSRARRGSRAPGSRRRSRAAPRRRSRRRRRRRRRGRARRASAKPSNAMAEGATVGQPPSSSGTEPRWRRSGDHVDALRPAWASWMPASAPRARMAGGDRRPRVALRRRSRCRCRRARCVPRARPRSPRRSRCPRRRRRTGSRWVWCHSCGTPSTALYWHIGATHRRLRAVRPCTVRGLKRRLMWGMLRR